MPYHKQKQHTTYQSIFFLLIGFVSCINGNTQNPPTKGPVGSQGPQGSYTRPTYRHDASGQWIPYRKGNDWYFVDRKGEKKLDVADDFQIVYPFQYGLAMVANEGCYGFMDRTGDWVIPCQLEEPHKVMHYRDNPRYVRLRKIEYDKTPQSIYGRRHKKPTYYWMGYDSKTNKLTDDYYSFDIIAERISRFDYSEVSWNSNSTSPYIKVKKNDKWGILDTAMQEIVPCNYEVLYTLKNHHYLVKQKDKCLVLNDKNEIIQKFKVDSISRFKDGFLVQKNKKFGLIDIEGNFSIPLEMDTIYTDKSNTNIVFKKDDYYGWALLNGKIIIDAKYDTCFRDNKHNIVFLKKGNTIHLINNKKGEMTIQKTLFSDVRYLNNLFWLVTSNGKKGLFKDQLLLPTKYKSINHIRLFPRSNLYFTSNKGNHWIIQEENLTEVFSIKADSIAHINPSYHHYRLNLDNMPLLFIKKNNKWGMLDNYGDLIGQIEYDDIQPFFYPKLFWVKQNEKWGVIDDQAQIIIPINETYKPFIKKESNTKSFLLKMVLEKGLACYFLNLVPYEEQKPTIKDKKSIIPLTANNAQYQLNSTTFSFEISEDLPNDIECSCVASIKKPHISQPASAQVPDPYKGTGGPFGPQMFTGAGGPRGPQGDTGATGSQASRDKSVNPYATYKLIASEVLSREDSLLFKRHKIQIRQTQKDHYTSIREARYHQYVPTQFEDLIFLDNVSSFVKKQGKWGIHFHIRNFYSIKPIYESLLYDKFNRMVRFGKINGKWFYLNECGEIEGGYKVISDEEFDTHQVKKIFSGVKYSRNDDGKVELLNSQDQAIPNTLSDEIVFFNNLLFLRKGNTWELFDTKTSVFSKITEYKDFNRLNNNPHNAMMSAKTAAGWFLINKELEKINTTPYDSIYYNSFSKTIFIEKNKKMGILYNGKEVLPPLYENLVIDRQFIRGKNKTIYVMLNKELLIYDSIEPFSGSLFLVKDEGQYGFIWNNGKEFYENE